MSSSTNDASAPLASLRSELASIDADLVALLARRLDVARRVGAHKRAHGLPTLNAGREAQVVAAAAQLAQSAGVPDEDVRNIFWQIVAMCRRVQQEDA